jgi:CRP/FNR family transcriptional regulator, cyclic AMP receptor protein
MNTTPLPIEAAANELYAMLSPELRVELAKYERTVTVLGGTQLIRRGMVQEQLVIVNSGRVEITLTDMHESISLPSTQGGRVFGMRAVVCGELPEVNVTSQENCQITVIPRDAFLATLRDHPQMYFAIAKVLSNDLVMAQRFLKTSLGRSVRRKTIAKSLRSGPH